MCGAGEGETHQQSKEGSGGGAATSARVLERIHVATGGAQDSVRGAEEDGHCS